MFPLGGVLFPSLYLPLHVFEPRYRALAKDCLAGERRFGVVLIERGSEVGGSDVRSHVGTIAEIIDAQELPDGRWALATVGTRRVQVDQWLPDAPYPRAEVHELDDEAPLADTDERYRATTSRLRRVWAMRSELGEPTPDATTEVADDATLGSYQLSALAPLGPHDQHRLLSAPGPDQRLRLLDDLLADEELFLKARLAMGD